ncbi:hypothetical protein ACE6H2_012003 [Prunus campanulata]
MDEEWDGYNWTSYFNGFADVTSLQVYLSYDIGVLMFIILILISVEFLVLSQLEFACSQCVYVGIPRRAGSS